MSILNKKKQRKNDVFETIDSLDIIDSLDLVEKDSFSPYKAPPKVSLILTDEIRGLIISEVGKVIKEQLDTLKNDLKPLPNEPSKIIETKIIQTEKIIKEIDLGLLEKTIQEKINKYTKSEEERWKNIAPIVVPNGIANMEGHGGQVLSTDGRITKWIKQTGGQSPDAYIANNVTTTRSYDATLTSLDELASVLGSLIQSLQGAGIIQ